MALAHLDRGDHPGVTPHSLYLHWLDKNRLFVDRVEGREIIITIERKKRP